MSFEEHNRDVIRKAAKLAGVSNVSYKTRDENITLIRAAGYADVTVGADGTVELVRNVVELTDEEIAAREELARRVGDEVTIPQDQLVPPARALVDVDYHAVHIVDAFGEPWCEDAEFVSGGSTTTDVNCPGCVEAFLSQDELDDEDGIEDELEEDDEYDPEADEDPVGTYAGERDPAALPEIEPDVPSALEQAMLDEASERDPVTEVPTFSLATDNAGKSRITLVVNDDFVTVDEDDERYVHVLERLLVGEDPTDLLDDGAALASVVESLSDRATLHVEGEQAWLTIDGEQVDGKLVNEFVRYHREGRDTGNLLAFLERVKSNPLPIAEVNLYKWGSNLTIDKDGYFIGFKAVHPVETGSEIPERIEDRSYRPSTKGRDGAVNGVPQSELPNGELRQKIGDVVTMPREKVLPGPECGVGLHVGTWGYSSTFSGEIKMEVRVDPADIVNVPNNETGKLRCVRYEVIGFHDNRNGTLTHHEPEATVEFDDEAAAETVAERVIAYVPDEEAAVTKNLFRRVLDGLKKGKS